MDFAATPFEIKALDDTGLIAGVGAAFGNVDQGRDRILFGAFTKSLAERGGRAVPMLLHHDQRRPIGAWTKLTETPAGLAVEGKLTLATRDAQEAYALAKDGALTGLSIGYDVKRQVHQKDARDLHEVGLHEVSLVAIPMNPLARVASVKAITRPADIEDMLRETGVSGRRAKAAASAAWKAINDSDDDHDAAAELGALFAASAARLTNPTNARDAVAGFTW